MGRSISTLRDVAEKDSNVQILRNLDGVTIYRNFGNKRSGKKTWWVPWLGKGAIAVSNQRIFASVGSPQGPKHVQFKNTKFNLDEGTILSIPWKGHWRTVFVDFSLIDDQKLIVSVDASLYQGPNETKTTVGYEEGFTEGNVEGTIEYHFEIGVRAVPLYKRILQLQHPSWDGVKPPLPQRSSELRNTFSSVEA